MNPSTLHRLQPQLYRLKGQRCEKCDRSWLGRRLRCIRCGHTELVEQHFSRTGTLICITQIAKVPRDIIGMVPCFQGIVQLDDGPRIPVLITDTVVVTPQVGDRGLLVTRRISMRSNASLIVYGYKFQKVVCSNELSMDSDSRD